MRTLLLLAALLWGAYPAAQVDPATIRGVVTLNTQEPLKEARVTLTRGTVPDSPTALVSAQPGVSNTAHLEAAVQRERQRAQAAASGAVSTTTSATGRFEFTNVVAGVYTVTVERDGYFGSQRRDGSFRLAESVAVTLAAGRPVPDLTFTLIRGGAISGRVTDPMGRPASNTVVAPYQTIYREGRLTLIATEGSVTTDDRGAYRIGGLAPGNYFIAAVPPRPTPVPGPRDNWSRTFYPSTTDPSSASFFTVRPSTEVSTADITIRTGGTFRVSGIVRNGPVNGGFGSFLLVPRGTIFDETVSYQFPNVAPDDRRRNGEFEVRVPQGYYDLFASAAEVVDRQVRTISGRTSVDVRGYDVTGAAVDVGPGVELRGQLVVRGELTPAELSAVRVGLRALDAAPSAPLTRVPPPPPPSPPTADGSISFEFPGVSEGLYTLNVGPLPSKAYIADIRDGDTSVFDSGIAVGRNAVNALQVIIGTDAQVLEGTVVDAERRPVPDATVALIPPALRRQNPLLYKSVISDASGKFRIAVPPGEFKLMAWEVLFPTAWMNADFVTRYEDRGVPISITTGGVPQVQIPVIPRGQ